MNNLHRKSLAYVVAVVAVVVAFLVRLVLVQAVGELPPFGVFYLAVMFVAMLGGLKPGLLATALAAVVVDWWIFPPFNSFRFAPPDLVAVGIFLAGGVFISVAAELHHRSHEKAAAYEKELALRESEEQFRLLVNEVEDYAIYMLDPQGRVLTWNAGAERIKGYRAEDILGQHFSCFYTDEAIRAGAPQHALETAASTGAFESEGWRVRKDGSRFWASVSITALHDDKGALRGFAKVTHDITESKEAEEDLKESEDRLGFALEVSNTGAWDLDLVNHTAHRSLRHDQIFGYESLLPQWTYEMFLDHVLPEDRGALDRQFQHAIATGGDLSFECRIRRQDGQIRWIWAAGRHRPDSNGKPTRMGGIVQDITERKLADEALRTSEGRFKSIFAEAPLGIAVVDSLNARFYSVNPMFAKITGRSAEELERIDWVSITHPDDIQGDLDRVAAMNAGRIPGFQMEKRYLRPSGDYFWVNITVAPMYVADTAHPRHLLMIEDISERKRAEHELERMKVLLSEGQRIAHVGSWEYVVDTQETIWSEEENRIHGLASGEPSPVYQEMLAKNIHPDDAAKFDQTFRQALQDGSAYELEHRIVRPDGSVRVVLDLAYPYLDERGNLVKYLGATLDITDRKRAEEELKALNETLERRVAEQTVKSQWRANQLQQLAAQMTQVEERERRRLSQVLHDDLQQMLVAAKIRLGGVSRRVVDEKASAGISEATNLIDEAIAESRSLTKELSPPVLYDNGLAAGLEWLGRETEKKYTLPVAVHVEPGIEPDDLTTKVFVFQAARELILNAVKHAHASRLEIRLSREGEDELQVTVQDDGIGFDTEVMNRKEAKGGFGLFSIRERLDVIGGQLTVTSSPIEGTTATISAPYTRIRTEPAGPTVQRLSPSGGASTRTNRIRVLLADDHPLLRKGIADMLMEHPDLNLLGEASNGQEALGKALELQPDVVLMDVTMPVMDGIEATRRIKEAAPGICIIGLSMHESDDMAVKMKEAGASEYLTKTAAAEDLIAVVLKQCPQPSRFGEAVEVAP
jgi:PAS domain S-box-containing protein